MKNVFKKLKSTEETEFFVKIIAGCREITFSKLCYRYTLQLEEDKTAQVYIHG